MAQLAAEDLSDAKSIDPTYLSGIKAGIERGLHWLHNALGVIENEDAAEIKVAFPLVIDSLRYSHNLEFQLIK